MKVFFDCEMTGLHRLTTLISIGMVTESGQQFYAEAWDYEKADVTPWIEENVIKNLVLQPDPPKTPTAWGSILGDKFTYSGPELGIKNMVAEWLKQFDSVEMWGDVMPYDWMLFCELFPLGYDSAERLPRNVYYIPFDIATLAKTKGVDPDFSRKEFSGNAGVAHNALADAFTIMMCYEKLTRMDYKEF